MIKVTKWFTDKLLAPMIILLVSGVWTLVGLYINDSNDSVRIDEKLNQLVQSYGEISEDIEKIEEGQILLRVDIGGLKSFRRELDDVKGRLNENKQ